MRPYLLAAAVALSAAVLPASSASAAGCTAVADAPTTYGDAWVFGSGRFTCAAPAAGMTVTVCLQKLETGDLDWHDYGCDSRTASTVRTVVSQDVAVCYVDGPALFRTTASGSNAAGDATKTASAPVLVQGVGSCGP